MNETLQTPQKSELKFKNLKLLEKSNQRKVVKSQVQEAYSANKDYSIAESR